MDTTAQLVQDFNRGLLTPYEFNTLAKEVRQGKLKAVAGKERTLRVSRCNGCYDELRKGAAKFWSSVGWVKFCPMCLKKIGVEVAQ